MNHRHDARIEELRVAIDDICLESRCTLKGRQMTTLSKAEKDRRDTFLDERRLLCSIRWDEIVAEYGHPLTKEWPKKRVPKLQRRGQPVALKIQKLAP